MLERATRITLALLMATSLSARLQAGLGGGRAAAGGNVRITALAQRIEADERALRAVEARRRAAEQARTIAADRLAAERAPLARLVATLVRDARRPAALALVAPEMLVDDERRRVALLALRPAIEARSAALRASLARSDATAARAAAALREVELAQRDLARERRVFADAAVARDQAQGLAEQAAGIDAQIDVLRRTARLGARLATLDGPLSRPDAADEVTSGPRAYRLAVTGRVLLGEGERSSAGARARGLTLATAPGATVVAPAAGRIAYAGPFRAWRAILILDHGHGWITLVTGLDRADARVGALAAQGEPIGRASKRITIELRHRGRPVDITGMVETS